MATPDVEVLGNTIDEAFLMVAAAVLVYELIKGITHQTLKRRTFQDMFASLSTLIPYYLVEVSLLTVVYLGYVYVSDTFVSWTLPINAGSLIGAVLACDFLYYWEHRLAHEIRLLWTQHAVHHSSRNMNVSVAFRFGAFEGVISTLIHFPLILIGLPPELVFFGIVVVLAYQSWIHTESIGRLGVLDKLLNTPSNHRVHHGCNKQYLDKNYGGILIIWDRLFGTYQAELVRPRYGLKRSFNSVNPLTVWISEWPGLLRDLKSTNSIQGALKVLFSHPDWVSSQSTEDLTHRHKATN